MNRVQNVQFLTQGAFFIWKEITLQKKTISILN